MVSFRSKKDIWVMGDLRNQRLLGLSYNVLAQARKLATDLDCKLTFVLFEGRKDVADDEKKEPIECISADQAARGAVTFGADQILCFENDCFNPPQAHIFATGLVASLELSQPLLCLFTMSQFCRDVAAYISAKCGLGLIADCVEFVLEHGQIVGLSPAWGGSVLARIVFRHNDRTGLATVHPPENSGPVDKGYPGEMKRQALEMSSAPGRLHLVASTAQPDSQSRLEDAPTVVAGGMGLLSLKGFDLLKDLAITLGAEMAATRPPVLKGWVSSDRMLGQTGKRIKPKLLITVGTSGAIQFTAGILASDFIIAINRDPAAAIFHIADLGIVADAAILLPLLIEKLKRRFLRNLADHLRDGSANPPNGMDVSFGEKIRNLRTSRKWLLEDLAAATGHLPEFIRKVEADGILPPTSFLLRLAEVMDVAPETFLEDASKAALSKERATAQKLRIQNSAYETLTDGADGEHLRAFLLTLKPRQHLKPVAYKHEGEEFLWVQSGTVELTLGDIKCILKEGASKHFNSNIPHTLNNPGENPAQCLVVLYIL